MSSQTIRYFVFADDKSSKFWAISCSGSSVTVRYGKTGSQGQTQTKDLSDEATALRHMDKLVAEKLSKGYVEKSDGVEVSTPPSHTRSSAPTRNPKHLDPAHDPEASAENLSACAGKDVATDRLLARHPNAGIELLETLSHSKDKLTRHGVVLHPNTPKEVLLALAPQFPADFFKNPSLDWLLLEDPDLIFKIGGGVLKNLLKRPDCPLSLMKWALKNGSESEQLALAMNPDAPLDILEALARRKGAVGDAARGRSHDRDHAESNATDLDVVFVTEVQKALSEVKPDEIKSAWKRQMITPAQWPWLSLECRLRVSDIPLALIVAGALPGHEQELAAHVQPEVRTLVARFLEEDANLMGELATDSSQQVRAALAENPRCPKAVYAVLVTDKSPSVRAGAARNSRVTMEIAETFSKDTSPMVREAVASCWSLREEFLQPLAQEKLAAIRTPAKRRLEQLASAAANPMTAPEELDRIAASAKSAVRLLLAANPATPIGWLRQYSDAALGPLDQALLENPRLPTELGEEIYRRHLDSLGPLQRINLLEQPRTPWVIRASAAEKSAPTYWPASNNWRQDAYDFLCAPRAKIDAKELLSIPRGMESQYAGSTLLAARLLGLAHPRTPPELLIKRLSSVNWAERLAIARNTSLPQNLVLKLQKDPHKLVAEQARETDIAKAQIKDHQRNLLEETRTPVDWESLIKLVTEGVLGKGIRPWEWYGTPWWQHLEFKERIGSKSNRHGYVYFNGMVIELGEFFKSSPFCLEQLIQTNNDTVREWIAGFDATPLPMLEEMFASEKNQVAQKNWLSRVRVDVDHDLPEKLGAIASDIELGNSKWVDLKGELMSHPDTPHEAMVQVAKSVEKAQEARWYLGFPNLPDKARELMNELLNAAEMRELDEKAMSPKADLRCSAAENPKTPVAALARLMKDKNKEVRQLAEENIRRAQLLSEVADLDKLHDLSADELRQKIQTLADRILHEAQGQRDAICAFAKTPPALLEALSKQKGVWSVAESLAENPNTPESVLVKLAGLYRQSEYPQDVCKELCANPSSTLSVFKALISSKSASVRARAASYTELPEELVSELASDSSPDVRKVLATRMDLSPQILAQLASDPVASVRVTVATRSDLKIATLLMLATDPDAAVAKAAVQREQHSAEFYRRYIDAGGRRLEPKHFSDIQDERLQELLIEEGEGFGWGGRTGFRQEIAADPRTPLNFLEVLLGDAEASVVARALTNPMIPEHLIRKTLDEKNSPAYWRAIQDNPLAPPELVVMSVNKVGSNRWAKSWYAQKMAGARLDEQLDAFLSNVMQWAADPRTPPDRLRSFAASGLWAVRFRVASNPSLPQDEALAMRTALWAEVGEALFGPAPPRLSAEVLSEDDIRGALDRLDLLPSADDKKAIAAAAKSKDALERIAAVLSPGVQPSILKMLLEDPVESIKSIAAEKLRATETNA